MAGADALRTGELPAPEARALSAGSPGRAHALRSAALQTLRECPVQRREEQQRARG